MRLHGARDDILLREVARLFLGEFAGGDEVEHQRVVAGAEDNACSRTQLIDSAVADVSHQHAVAAAGCKGEGGTHGAARGWGSVYRVELVVGCFERRLKHGAHLGGGAERQDCRLLAHRLGYAGACHLAVLVAAHAVAHQEHALAGGGFTYGREDGVFLVGLLSYFTVARYLAQADRCGRVGLLVHKRSGFIQIGWRGTSSCRRASYSR